MYFKKRHRTHHKHDLGKLFAWLALTTGLANAAFWTIFPLVVKNVIKSEALVGIFFSIISVIAFGGSLLSTVILRKISRVKIMKWGYISCTIFILLFTLIITKTHLYFLEIPRALFTLIVGIVLSLYIRDTAKAHQLGLAEGRYYLYANIGWLIGPIIGGYLGQLISRDAVFVFSALLYLTSFLIFQHQHFKKHPLIKHKKEKQTANELFSNIKYFFKIKELWKVYAIAFGLNYWWAVSSIYIPLYIISNGFGDNVVGWVVAGGILPLVLFEKLIGKLADKHGLRIYLAIGFLILALVTVFFNLISFVPIVLILMAVVNLGAALIEPLQETYLFKIIKKKDEERFYGVYNTADPLANILGPLIAAGFILMWGLPGVWYGSAAILLIFMLISLKAKK
jgi:MFS family permease